MSVGCILPLLSAKYRASLQYKESSSEGRVSFTGGTLHVCKVLSCWNLNFAKESTGGKDSQQGLKTVWWAKCEAPSILCHFKYSTWIIGNTFRGLHGMSKHRKDQKSVGRSRETWGTICNCPCQYPQDRITSAIMTVMFFSEMLIYIFLPYTGCHPI